MSQFQTIVRVILAIIACVVVGCASSGTTGVTAGGKSSRSYESIAARSPESRGLAPAEQRPWPAPEELWVLAKPSVGARPHADQGPAQDVPGTPALMTRLPGDPRPVPVPLHHTEVRANISGFIASVDVTQKYHNPYDGKIEALYVFPLPSNAAVNEFIMTIGQRRIRGIVRERQEAEQIYRDARSQGMVASLLTQERPNVFTQAVANIEPGKAIDVSIRYFHTLTYSDGWFEFVFPMVVGPRFNPPGTTDGIGAVMSGSAVHGGQSTQVTYLPPQQRSGHDISLSVAIDAGMPVHAAESRNHRIVREPANAQHATIVRLDQSDSIPNKDFVLRYRVGGEQPQASVLVQADPNGTGGHFAMLLAPPMTPSHLPRQPLEMTFLLDVSGSVNGKPLEQAQAAIRAALGRLGEADRFQIIAFDSSVYRMTPAAVPATQDNVRRAHEFLEATHGGGGTMMLDGIRAALTQRIDDERLGFVVLLSDGYISNEADIIHHVYNARGSGRVFSFGVGSSVNRYLLDGIAKAGAGCAAYLGLNDDARPIMDEFMTRVSQPAMTNLAIDLGSDVGDVYPRKLPDLFVGRPVMITGQYRGAIPQSAAVRAKQGGQMRELRVPVATAAAGVSGIRSVWARMKLADLDDQRVYTANADLAALTRQTALEHGLMSAYTAFVAVDSMQRTAGGRGTTVPMPVPVPEGVRYETSVGER